MRDPKDRTAGVLSTALPAGATQGGSPDLRPGIAGAPAEDPETVHGYEDPEAGPRLYLQIPSPNTPESLACVFF